MGDMVASNDPLESSDRAAAGRSQASQTSEKDPHGDGQKRPQRSYAVLAGWMTVVAGVLAFFNGFMSLFGHSSIDLFDIFIEPDRYTICGIAIMASGVIAILGGISAIRGWNISLALVGAALGMMGGGIVGFWLGIASILFLFLSSEDF